MPLRLEGHALLWAIALLSVAAAVARAMAEPPQIAHEVEQGPEATVARVARVPEDIMQRYPRSLPELATSGRTLFAAVPGRPVEPVAMPAQAEAALPLLKGVISDGAVPRAVFGVSGDPSSYVTVGLGELAVGYRIERIEADRVVAVAPGGETVVLKLRGVGELP